MYVVGDWIEGNIRNLSFWWLCMVMHTSDMRGINRNNAANGCDKRNRNNSAAGCDKRNLKNASLKWIKMQARKQCQLETSPCENGLKSWIHPPQIFSQSTVFSSNISKDMTTVLFFRPILAMFWKCGIQKSPRISQKPLDHQMIPDSDLIVLLKYTYK